MFLFHNKKERHLFTFCHIRDFLPALKGAFLKCKQLRHVHRPAYESDQMPLGATQCFRGDRERQYGEASPLSTRRDTINNADP